jgi:hypothetical protein
LRCCHTIQQQRRQQKAKTKKLYTGFICQILFKMNWVEINISVREPVGRLSGWTEQKREWVRDQYLKMSANDDNGDNN